MAQASFLDSARFTAAQPDLTIRPRIRRTPKAPVIFMTGGGGTALTGVSSAAPILTALVEDGFSVFMPSVPWLLGNPTSATRIADAVTYARANGATNDPPILIGVSNGAVCALGYARSNAVSAVVTIIAPIDMNYARDNDVLSTRAFIDAAWGVTYPAALPAHADSWTDRADFVGKNIQMWGASDDPFNNPAHTPAQFASAAGASFTSVGALGHTDAAVLAVPPASVLAYVKAKSGF